MSKSKSSMNYGFVIDNRKCIGCHACSTACKSENEVPLGVYRTWVKYVEKGTFPNTRRHFQVTRCNHCSNPPCVRICPVTAMYQRDDGIVDFDPKICIGCKACLQACPYDAIHLDPDSGTAAKCNYCAHRTEIGLEPSCVVVCPEHAIISGDLEDPNSEIRSILDSEKTSVRKPEQGTGPNLFYVEGEYVSLVPTASATNATMTTVELATDQAKSMDSAGGHGQGHGHEQGMGSSYGPIQIGDGTMAEQMVQTVYNAQHKIPWHWQVPAYMVTKSIAAGLFLVVAMLGLVLPSSTYDSSLAKWAGGVSLLFTAITTALLVLDLERPERFLNILLRPQWKSWLTKGSFILIGFSLVSAAWFGGELLWGNYNVLSADQLEGAQKLFASVLRPGMFAIGSILALLTAIYTAFLLGQAEGRDLWQSALLPIQLGVRAVMGGCGALIVCWWFVEYIDPIWLKSVMTIFLLSVAANLGLIWAEFAMPHASDVAARAAHDIVKGKYHKHFWAGGILVGSVIPLVFLAVSLGCDHCFLEWGGAAFLASMIGLYFYEYAFIAAPQEVPNS